jgi:hypothetical protein
MKLIILFLISIITVNANAFFLLSQNPPRYEDDEIPIRVIDNDCTNVSMTSEEIGEFAQEALDDYWNTVSSTRVSFRVAGTVTMDPALDINTISATQDGGTIVVGCSTNTTDFTSTSTLAKGGIASNISGPKGLVMINDTAGTLFETLSRQEQKSTFAHEFGHAIGIGHSNVKYSLMYYAVTSDVSQEKLSEDDADAISFLYPNPDELGGLAGSCGTIQDIDDSGNFPGNMLFALTLGMLLTLFVKVLVAKSVKLAV